MTTFTNTLEVNLREAYQVIFDYIAGVTIEREGGDGYMTPNRAEPVISEIEITSVTVISEDYHYEFSNIQAARFYFGEIDWMCELHAGENIPYDM